jgi:hypothetical protein
MQQSVETMNGGMGRPRPQQGGEGPEFGDEFGDEDGDDVQSDSPVQPVRGQEPQPRVSEGQPRFENRPPRQPHGHGRLPRERINAEREPFGRERERPQPEGSAVEAGPGGPPRGEGQQQRRRERFGHTNDQPEFLRRSVRRPRRDSDGDGETSEPVGGADMDNGDNLDKSSA